MHLWQVMSNMFVKIDGWSSTTQIPTYFIEAADADEAITKARLVTATLYREKSFQECTLHGTVTIAHKLHGHLDVDGEGYKSFSVDITKHNF